MKNSLSQMSETHQRSFYRKKKENVEEEQLAWSSERERPVRSCSCLYLGLFRDS